MAPKHPRGKQVELYREPVTTPGVVPSHLKRATVDANPFIEVAQRFLIHIKPGSGASIEKLVALVALYKVVSPVWRYIKELALRLLTSRISIPEYDPVAQEVIQWVSAQVINKSRLSTSATVVTGITPDTARYVQEMYGGLGGYLAGGKSRTSSVLKLHSR